MNFLLSTITDWFFSILFLTVVINTLKKLAQLVIESKVLNIKLSSYTNSILIFTPPDKYLFNDFKNTHFYIFLQ